MAFLNAKWTERRLGVPVTIVDKFVVHEAEEVDVEAHWAQITDDEQEVFADSNDNDFNLEPRARSSWTVRLKNKIKKTFYLRVEI